jgi:signal transduction histidine kinase
MKPMPVPNILVIEDSKSVQAELVRRIEKDLRFNAHAVGSLAAARAALAEGEWFLAIVDLALPDSDDGAVVDAVLEHGLPCLVFTSDITQETRQRILAKSVTDYVVKNRHAVDNLVTAVGRLHRIRGRKALVVDDSRSMRRYLKNLLSLHLLDVVTVETGEQALAVLQEDPNFLLAVVDYELDGMDGVELTVKIRARRELKDLGIIGISSFSGEPLSVRFIKNGANDFLRKPFEREEFQARMFQLVDTVERQRRLRELDEIKNRLLGMAAHDLRNPINAVNGFAGILLQTAKSALDENQQKMLEYIQLAGWQMNALVSDLLDISVIESGRLELCCQTEDIASLMIERVDMARLMAGEKNIEISIDRNEPVSANVDRRRIGQVIDNLLTNAIKFSSSDTHVSVGFWSEGDNACFQVRDQGPGIPSTERDKLFLSFQKLTNRPTAGEVSTGLGLAIVKKIVEAHQGRVQVESERGKGTCFRVCLPLQPHC